MRLSEQSFPIANVAEFKQNLFEWCRAHDPVAYYDSNFHSVEPSAYETVVAAGQHEQLVGQPGTAFESLRKFIEHPSWIFGFLTYDLKNEVEELQSNNDDGIGMPALFFFRPQHVFLISNKSVTVLSGSAQPQRLFDEVQSTIASPSDIAPVTFNPRFNKSEYCAIVEKVREHIAAGDVYELNLCQEFYREAIELDPFSVFARLNNEARTPFAAFVRTGSRYLLSASPERFLAKRGGRLISQPMKGTIRRGADLKEDQQLRSQLLNDPKERAENIMITDLVRNDLAKSSKPGSVSVEELCGIYSFEGVHQMITTVTSELIDGLDLVTAIRNAFPMGSMTGAPKVAAMELIERYEKTKRGLYSGSVGYFAPNGDFDFNVVIRSLIYNASTGYLSLQTGGAITYDSDPESEWEECRLKAETVMTVFN